MTLRRAQGGRFGDRAAELAGIASTLLGWRPHEFWDSTPCELEVALGAGGAEGPQMDRAEMDRLAQLFPDNRGNDGR